MPAISVTIDMRFGATCFSSNVALMPAAGIDIPPFVTIDFAARKAGPPTVLAYFATSVAAGGIEGAWDCYSASSGLLVATRSTQKNPMGEIPVLTLYNDYKKFGDVMVPTKMTQEAMGQQQVLTVSSVVFGDGTEVVAPPAAVQALIKPAK